MSQSIWDQVPTHWDTWSEWEPTPSFNSEQALADHVLDRLDPWFTVDPQVWGTACDGKRVRIDAVLRPRDPSSWKDADPAFAVEFKNPGRLASGDGFKLITAWQAQCIDYSHTKWDNYGRLAIFSCPGFTVASTGYSDDRMGTGFSLSHLFGQFRVGELRNTQRYGWTLILNGHHRQWSQRRGVEYAKYTRFVPATGSR